MSDKHQTTQAPTPGRIVRYHLTAEDRQNAAFDDKREAHTLPDTFPAIIAEIDSVEGDMALRVFTTNTIGFVPLVIVSIDDVDTEGGWSWPRRS